MFLWCLSAKKDRKENPLVGQQRSDLNHSFSLSTFLNSLFIQSFAFSPHLPLSLSFLMEPLSLFLRLIPSSTQLSPRVTDFFSLTPCLTTSPCASLRLPLFIFVTQSFLRSLFPCLTQSLSILISLSLCLLPHSFLSQCPKSFCLSVSFVPCFTFFSPPSLICLTLSHSFLLRSLCLFCSLFHSLHLFLFPLSLSKKLSFQ